MYYNMMIYYVKGILPERCYYEDSYNERAP